MNGFEPQYNYFINQKENILEIRVELPGNTKPIIHPIKYKGENTVIGIEGEKRKDKEPKYIEDNIFNSRDFGNFFLEIQFKTEDYKIKSKIKNAKLVQGILLLQYEIEEEEEKIELEGNYYI